jgi:hypothetical protein
MVLTCFLNDFEMVPVAPIIAGFIIIIIIIISFMQGIYTYIPETNNVPKEYNVIIIIIFFFWLSSPARAMASSFTRFHNHI